MLFEGFAKGRVTVVASGQSYFGNVYCPHAQLASGAFQAHTADVSGDVLAHFSGEDAMEVGDGEASNGCQYFAVEWFVGVIMDVLFDVIDTVTIVVRF